MTFYLGIDASTQGIKTVVIDPVAGEIVGGSAVNFGVDLPEYRAPNGYRPHPDPLVKQADPLMWVAGLELALARLVESGVDLAAVAGISGSGQQHGSVYLNDRFESVSAALDLNRGLAEQLRPALSRELSPIWMDRSTAAECRELATRFGDRMQRDTGSPAVERFTGPQIRRWANLDPESYRQTRHIHLVSSFMASVLCGRSVPVDYGDGAGMNLLNLKTLQWDQDIVAFTAPGLADKLPPVVPAETNAGFLQPWFARYGFRPGIPVTVWTGDNPSSLIGVGAGTPGMAVISLGTSDTFFAAMREFKTDPAGCGHVFGNPAGGFMSLICFTNGSPARERIKELCGADWNFFDVEACRQTMPGNGGKLMLPYYEPESTPLVLQPGVKYNFTMATPAERIRAILESQALGMKLHSAWQGEIFHRIRVTGGASKSPAFRQILADVFQAEIETIAVSNSAGLGAAIRAAHAAGFSWESLSRMFCRAEATVKPDASAAEIYRRQLAAYAELEKSRREID